jgi:hypothetical protein
MPDYQGFTFTGWVVTNTRFSPDSTQFGRCSGLKLLGWDYPEGAGLKELIARERVYPVTVISKLSQKEKMVLMEHGFVTCARLLAKKEALDVLGFNKKKLLSVIRELEEIA